MTGAEWERVEALFSDALARPAEDRAEYVAATGEASEVRNQVLALLSAHDGRGAMDSIADFLHNFHAPASISLADLLAKLRTGLSDRYRVERELGRGGMAIVLLAEDLKHKRRVAIKVLQPELALNLGTPRFLQEITIAASLAHPHILPVHDSGEASGLLYYVMPYVEGESLRDHLRREGPLQLDEALRITRQIADALEYAHARNVVHRDIKPENILLEAGHAVVSDFGIARAMTAAGADDLGETGVILGTPAYMSPEQAVGDRVVDGRSDIYSLGCVLYEMLTGTPPFSGESAEAVLEQHLTAPPATLTEVPEAVDAVVQRALQKTRSARFATARELADALPGSDALIVNRRRGRRRIAAIGVVAMLVATVAIASVALRARSPVPPAAAVMAVLPLVSAAPDTGLTRLGRDLVVTLSAGLEGAGKIRTIDALTVLAQTRGSGPLALEEGARLAGLLGASSFVHGAVARVDSQIRIDVAVFTTANREPLARASAIAPARQVHALTDSLTQAIMRALWRAPHAPAPTLAATTTRSLPALQAFLEGEYASLENRWKDAADAYARAMAADSTFWLARWRYSYARWWYLDAVDDAILNPLYAHRNALPDRDRLVLESWWTDSFPLGLARAREVVRRFPDYWPGWMQYSDVLFHTGPVYGHDPSEAQEALERTVALNPSFLAAWEHLLWASMDRDTVATARALGALERLGFGSASRTEFGFDLTRVYRVDVELARSGRLDEALVDSIVEDLRHRARRKIAGGTTLLRTQVEISRRVLALRPQPALAAVHERLLADALAGRGAWNSALVVAELFAGRPHSEDPLDAYRLAVIGAWSGAIAPAGAAAHRANAARAAAEAGDAAWRTELAWLDGLLAVTRRDEGGLSTARATLRADTAATTRLLDQSLAAFEMELHGSRGAAARTLADLNWSHPDLLAPGYVTHPYVIAVSRLAAARWLLSEGDTTRAVPLLSWFDAGWALDGYRPARRVLLAFTQLERARVAEARGDTALARREYTAFLRRYDMPLAGHTHLVDQARRAVALLR